MHSSLLQLRRVLFARPLIVGLMAVVCCCVALLAQETNEPTPETEAEPSTPVTTRTVTVVDGDRSFRAPFVTGIRGPLFALQPLADAWRGELSVGPLGQRHELTIADQSFLFGPGATQISVGGELTPLSQAPRAGVGGIYVPLDFLDLTFAGLGLRFEWQPQPPTLIASRSDGAAIRARPSVTTIGEVTTLVLEFAKRPRYRIKTERGRATVSFLGNRIELAREAGGGRLRSLSADDGALVLALAPNTGVRSYTLDDPFRLVLDLVPERQRIEVGDGDEEARSTFVPPSRGRGPYTVVIDPGHGGDAAGAQGRSGVEEKAITLQVARQLANRLRGADVRTVLTRTSDEALDLTDRTAIANHEQADLFVSLHVNSAYGRSAHGAETFFLSLEASDEDAAALAAAEDGNGDDDGEAGLNDDLAFILWDLAQSHHLAESQRLAKLVQGEFNASLGLLDRGVKQAPFRVLRGANMPAILVELGFISNPEEERKLQDSGYQRQLVNALVRAIVAFRGQEADSEVAAAETAPADGPEG